MDRSPAPRRPEDMQPDTGELVGIVPSDSLSPAHESRVPGTVDDRLLGGQSRGDQSQRIIGLLAERVDLHLASVTLRPNLDGDRVSLASEIVDERHGPNHDHKDNQYHQTIGPPT